MKGAAHLGFLIFGLGAGGAIGCLGTLQWQQLHREPPHESRIKPAFDETPEELLYPAEVTWESLIPDPAVRAMLQAPDAVTFHSPDEGGGIHAGGRTFATAGRIPDAESRQRLVRTLCSLSSYEPPGKVCLFHPDVLVRLRKGNATHDLLFCFTCRQIESDLELSDISLQGAKSFLKCFCDTLSGDEGLKKAREAAEGGSRP